MALRAVFPPCPERWGGSSRSGSPRPLPCRVSGRGAAAGGRSSALAAELMRLRAFLTLRSVLINISLLRSLEASPHLAAALVCDERSGQAVQGGRLPDPVGSVRTATGPHREGLWLGEPLQCPAMPPTPALPARSPISAGDWELGKADALVEEG